MADYLVTGGSGDIGRAVVDRLLDEGHRVICHYFAADVTLLKERWHSKPVTFWQADLTVELVNQPDFCNDIDGLIYAAGTAHYELLQDMSSEAIDKQYAIHLKNLIKLVQWIVPALVSKQCGNIVIISSIWGETGAAMESIYSTMKSGQLGFTRAMAKELAPSHITVNAVTPGLVQGKMTDIFPEEELKMILEDIPQGELVLPHEIAHMVSYLLDERSRHVTGQVLRINAGWLI